MFDIDNAKSFNELDDVILQSSNREDINNYLISELLKVTNLSEEELVSEWGNIKKGIKICYS